MNTTANQHNIFEQYLPVNDANYVALTPVSFLQRAAAVYPDKIATVNGDIRHSWLTVWQIGRAHV